MWGAIGPVGVVCRYSSGQTTLTTAWGSLATRLPSMELGKKWGISRKSATAMSGSGINVEEVERFFHGQSRRQGRQRSLRWADHQEANAHRRVEFFEPSTTISKTQSRSRIREGTDHLRVPAETSGSGVPRSRSTNASRSVQERLGGSEPSADEPATTGGLVQVAPEQSAHLAVAPSLRWRSLGSLVPGRVSRNRIFEMPHFLPSSIDRR